MLEAKFPELYGVSKSTISRWLKSELNMSYQKYSTLSVRAWTENNKRKMMESAALLLSLAHGGTELVFVDEFTFQPRSIKMYGWAEKNSKPVIKSLLEPISFSFIVALSYRKYYVYAVSDSTNNSTKFKEYLEKLISDIRNNMDQNDTKFYIVADNSSIHKTKEIGEFLAESKIGLADYFSL